MEELVALAEQRHRDPEAVLRAAEDLLAGGLTPDVEPVCHWVIGLALHELGRMPEAIASYRRAVEGSVANRLPDNEAKARAGLAVSLVSAGDAEGAVAEIARAREVATHATQGVVEMLHGLVLQRTGRLAEAQGAFSRALKRLEETGELTAIARLRLNRGVLRAYRGDAAGAVEDLEAAADIASREELPVLIAMATHNLGFAHSRRGDLAEALAAFSRAEEAYAALDRPGSLAAVLEADRCEVLLLAGLVTEARRAAERAVSMVPADDVAYATECRLLLARALLAGGDFGRASAAAAAAAATFREAGRMPWAALAEYTAIQAEAVAAEEEIRPPPGLLARCQNVGAELDRRGWRVEAVHVGTFVGRMALAMGQPTLARAELERAAGARARGTADLRARAWHAQALLLLAEGDRAGARRALERGLRVVDDHLASLGATELRAHAAGYGTDLARLGVRLALEDRRPLELFRWADRWRASSLRRPPVRPPRDDRLVSELAELRRVRSNLREAALGGEPTDALEREAVSLEASISRRSHETRGAGAGDSTFDLAACRARLGERVLVEYVGLEGRLGAIVLTASRNRLVDLAGADEVERERDYLMFALRRRLRGRGGDADRLVESAARRLDDLLLRPLRLPDDVGAVVVPTGLLHGLPWGCLPSLATRPLTVAPSAALWSLQSWGSRRDADGDSEDPDLAGGGVLLVAGPGLPGAEDEVGRIAALHAGADVLAGAAAAAGAVLEGLGRSQLVHLAAHGRFRSDSPLFSSVLLADGPLTVHEVERLPHAPRTVVLASCNAAVSGIEPGDELVGTAATLLARGVCSVVGPVLSVPDVPTADLMVALHRALLAGASPSEALAGARAAAATPVGDVFVCVGRDDRRISNRTRK